MRRFERLFSDAFAEHYARHSTRDERAARLFLAYSGGNIGFALERVEDAFAHSRAARDERRFDLLESFALDFAREFRPRGGEARRQKAEAARRRAAHVRVA